MIRDPLEATRAEGGKMRIEARCIASAELIEQAVAMMRPTAEGKQIGLEIGLDHRIPLVHAYPDRELKALINLLDDGIKFTPADGSAVVEAGMVETDPGVVYASVTDTGRGISAEAKALIFAPLSGSGMGRQQSLRPGISAVHQQRADPAARRTDLDLERTGTGQHVHLHGCRSTPWPNFFFR